MNARPVFSLTNLTKAYPGRSRPVLSVDGPLEVPRGDVLAVVGPSGAGKSTLLRVLAMIERPTSGAIEAFGTRLDAAVEPPLTLRRRVTLVYQRPLLQSASVRDNVAFGLRVRGLRDHHAAVEAALDRVKLRHLERAQTRSLSGGEAQRVALARALVIEPEVLLLDEPTANLDPYNVSVIEDAVRALNRDQGTTVVLVTHNVFQARRLASQAWLMLEGQVIEASEARAFFDAPRDARTSAFVRGEMVY